MMWLCGRGAMMMTMIHSGSQVTCPRQFQATLIPRKNSIGNDDEKIIIIITIEGLSLWQSIPPATTK